MPEQVHHLNCGTGCPLAGGLLSAIPDRFICRCLLIETREGLVLVDAGLGTDDVARPIRRLGLMSKVLGLRCDPEETAIAQIRALGHDPRDVRHIVVTHLDLDHAGGLADFPEAHVHVLEEELEAAQQRIGPTDRSRYRPVHWAHGPAWVPHAVTRGESWHGFECVREIPGLPPELLLVPLPGHTRGHMGVAIQTGDGWLLHAGDAYYDRREIAAPEETPRGIGALRAMVDHDADAVERTRARLVTIAERRNGDVQMFCSHDPDELPAPR